MVFAWQSLCVDYLLVLHRMGRAMIRYTLRCDAAHEFESWFASGAAFESLRDGGRLECTICASRSVDRAVMAPRVRTSRAAPGQDGAQVPAEAAPHAAEPDQPSRHILSAPPDSKLAQLVRAFRDKVERETEYVGSRFVHEARAIHTGDAPERAIRGEADPKEARRLIEDGITVVPLPFLDTKKTN